jgi:pimeloyl-ACP methyl ester carboxylesterase
VSAVSLILFPAGPGLNGAGDRVLFAPRLAPLLDEVGRRLHVWDEPSLQRGPLRPASDAWHGYLASARACFESLANEAPVILLGHSFGLYPVLDLARRFPERVQGVVLIAPTTDVERADAAILDTAARDFAAAGSPKAAELAARRAELPAAFSEQHVSALALAFEASGILSVYSAAPDRFVDWFTCFRGRYAVDFAQFGQVRRAFVAPTVTPLDIPAVAVFGGADRMVDEHAALTWLRPHLPRLRRVTADGAGHYLQMDAPDVVVEAVRLILAEPADGAAPLAP